MPLCMTCGPAGRLHENSTMFDQFVTDRACMAAAAPADVHAPEAGLEALHILQGESHSSPGIVLKACLCLISPALHVAGIAADVLGRAIGQDEPFMAAGLDSLGAIEFQSAIAARFGTSMPATLVVDFPTIRSLLPAVVSRAQPLQPTRVQGTAAWQHQHAGTNGRAAEVLQETLAVIADVLGGSIQADTPFMEVRRLPCLSLPAPRQTSCLHTSACRH
jgi:acyl carrier protein